MLPSDKLWAVFYSCLAFGSNLRELAGSRWAPKIPNTHYFNEKLRLCICEKLKLFILETLR